MARTHYAPRIFPTKIPKYVPIAYPRVPTKSTAPVKSVQPFEIAIAAAVVGPPMFAFEARIISSSVKSSTLPPIKQKIIFEKTNKNYKINENVQKNTYNNEEEINNNSKNSIEPYDNLDKYSINHPFYIDKINKSKTIYQKINIPKINNGKSLESLNINNSNSLIQYKENFMQFLGGVLNRMTN